MGILVLIGREHACVAHSSPVSSLLRSNNSCAERRWVWMGREHACALVRSNTESCAERMWEWMGREHACVARSSSLFCCGATLSHALSACGWMGREHACVARSSSFFCCGATLSHALSACWNGWAANMRALRTVRLFFVAEQLFMHVGIDGREHACVAHISSLLCCGARIHVLSACGNG